MNKAILSLIAGLFISQFTFAQLPDGSTSPDFTATDINGVSHSLYSDYLNKGMPVIVDISATWCGPCWTFHNGHALKDLYLTYGPGGSNEVGVLFIEGDGSTGQAELEGSGNTQGNWIEGTPYPIIDDASVGNVLQAPYYPTIYGICPNGQIYEFGQGSAGTLKNQIISLCSVSPTGAENNVSLNNSTFEVCESGQNVTPNVEVTNHGTNTLTSIDVELYSSESTEPIETIEWTGNLNSMSSTNISFSELTNIVSSQNFTAVVTNVNEVIDEYNYDAINVSSVNVNLAPYTNENQITITINTDNYPAETSWQLVGGEEGGILASYGPYSNAGAADNGSGGEDANQSFEYPVTLPTGNQCYELIILDTYGDGLSLGTECGYGITTSSGVSIINNFTSPSFGSEEIVMFSSVSHTPSWKCVDNACVDPLDGSGDFANIESCLSQCAMVTFDCNTGNCEENTNGTGEFVSMTLCQQNCEATPSPSNLEENILDDLQVNIYPNPVSSNTTIEISALGNSEIMFSVIDVLGKTISSDVHNVNSGINKLNINTNNLKNGIYFVKLTSKGKSSIHKITVAK